MSNLQTRDRTDPASRPRLLNPTSVEADELRQKGASPFMCEDDTVGIELPPEEGGESLGGGPQQRCESQRPGMRGTQEGKGAPKTNLKENEDTVTVNRGEEVEGALLWAWKKIVDTISWAQQTTYHTLAERTNDTKEAIRKGTAAAVIDAEHLYESGKRSCAETVESVKAKGYRTKDDMAIKVGHALQDAGARIAAAGHAQQTTGDTAQPKAVNEGQP